MADDLTAQLLQHAETLEHLRDDAETHRLTHISVPTDTTSALVDRLRDAAAARTPADVPPEDSGYRRLPLTASSLEELLSDVIVALTDLGALTDHPVRRRVGDALEALLGVGESVSAGPPSATGYGAWPDVVDLLDTMAEDAQLRAPYRAIARQAAADLRRGRSDALARDTRRTLERLRDRSRLAVGSSVATRMDRAATRFDRLANRAADWSSRRK